MRTLVIGGSGMLLGTVQHLLDAGDDVYLLARRAPALAHPRLRPLCADYRATAALREALASQTPFDRAVAWIHSDAPDAPFIAAEYVQGPFFHVLSSSAADPTRPQPEREQRFRQQGSDWRPVVLGFVREGGRSRWLTDHEISEGVWTAVRAGRKRTVVGQVAPWEERPGQLATLSGRHTPAANLL